MTNRLITRTEADPEGWVNIKNRLPDSGKTVLIWSLHIGQFKGYLAIQGWERDPRYWVSCLSGSSFSEKEVTHWRAYNPPVGPLEFRNAE